MADEPELELETEPEETTSTETETTPETTANQEPETATAGGETEPETTEPDKGEEEDDASILAYVKEKYGEDLTGKYADDDAMIRGLVEAQKLVGRRNDEAEAWRQFQKTIAGRERDLQAFLEGRQPEPEKKESKNGEPPEYDPAWRYQITQDDQGNYVPVKGAPPDVVQKYLSYHKWRENQLDTFLRDPQSYLGKVLDAKTREIEERLQRTSAEQMELQRQKAEEEAFFARNQSLLFQNGKETPLQAAAKNIYNTTLARMPDGVEKMQTALDIALSRQPKSPIKKPSPHATRKTPVSVHPEEKTLDDYMKDSDNPSEAFMRYYAERQKAGAKVI